MASLSDKVLRILGKLDALSKSSNSHEAAAARQKIRDLLKRYGLACSDVSNLLHEQESMQRHQQPPNDLNVLDMFRYVLEESVSLTQDQAIAVTLWIAHTFVFSH